MRTLDIGYLNQLYLEADTIDKPLFAEMRSNLLLVSGEHYNKKDREAFTARLRDTRSIKESEKLRLTKNHMAKIMGLYYNNILSGAPGVQVVPDIDNEIQDQKAAELHGAVVRWANEEYKLKSDIRDWVKDYCDIGECAVKVYWDNSKGRFLGYAPLVDELGQMVVDQMGNPVPDEEQPVWQGGFCFERLFGFDLLRAPNSISMEDSPYLIYRKMVSIRDLKLKYASDPEKLGWISESMDETYLIFDTNAYVYGKSKQQLMVREFYWRPCAAYPRGYFAYAIQGGILEEGELPEGKFPIIWKAFNKHQKTPRGRSQIKQLRPYQIEINRCASQIATHQVTLGDDKLVGNTLGKVEMGGVVPGVRFIKTNGVNDLKILPGRSGEQYLGYMQQQITEMYDIANLREESEEDSSKPVKDPLVNLYKSLKQKKKFTIYIEQFEEFLCEVYELLLTLAKVYLPDELLIPAIGKKEYINVAEFRSAEPVGYRIDVVPRSDDIETLMGKQIVLNHVLQYAGQNLEQESIGKIIRNMPFANVEDTFDELTIDNDNAKNDILSLERGEMPPVRYYDNHDYLIRSLTHRMRQPDFVFLPPEIQQLFQQKLQEHEIIKAQQLLEQQRAAAGFIPTGGYMVKADFYISTEDGKTKRATLPYESLAWLLEQLKAQGMSQEALDKMSSGARADIAQLVNQGTPNPQPIT